jgi:hypothetical protein
MPLVTIKVFEDELSRLTRTFESVDYVYNPMR